MISMTRVCSTNAHYHGAQPLGYWIWDPSSPGYIRYQSIIYETVPNIAGLLHSPPLGQNLAVLDQVVFQSARFCNEKENITSRRPKMQFNGMTPKYHPWKDSALRQHEDQSCVTYERPSRSYSIGIRDGQSHWNSLDILFHRLHSVEVMRLFSFIEAGRCGGSRPVFSQYSEKSSRDETLLSGSQVECSGP